MGKYPQEQGLVSTEEAKEITGEHRFCRDLEWGIDRGSKEDRTEQVFSCGSPVEDASGFSVQGLWVGGCYTFGKRTMRQKLLFTLERNNKKFGQRERVVQIDVRSPVNRKGGKTDLNWPHVHFGQEREPLDGEVKDKEIDVEKAISIFEDRSNIEFDPNPGDPNKLVLV